jgi:uncharacterized protein
MSSDGVDDLDTDSGDIGGVRPRRRLRRGTVAVGGIAALAVVVAGSGLGLALSDAGTAAPAAPATAGCGSGTSRLTVQGTGQATGTPDVLTAVFSFSATAGSSTDALAQNNAQVGKALSALKGAGVASRDLRTTALTLAPQYVFPHGAPVLTGYLASETLSATLRDTSTAGASIDAVVTATGDAAQIQSLSFSFGDPTKVQDQARSNAVSQARSHAESMAASAERRLGALCSLTDNTQPTSPVYQNQGYDAAGATNAAAVPLEPGTQLQSDQVTLVYALVRR